MFYNIYQGGGGLGQLRPAGINRRHQDGPAAAQLVERGKLGGVLAQVTAKRPRLQGAIKEPCGVSGHQQGGVWEFRISNCISVVGANSTRSQSERGPRPSPTSSDFPPAGALLLFIFKNPPPSPHDQPWSTRTTDARRASEQSRERSSQARPRDSR